MNLASVSTLPITPQTGTWYRATPPQFYPASMFQVAYTSQVVSRFSAGANSVSPYQTLYLAQTPELALLETENVLGSPGNTVANLRAITLHSVEVRLFRLVDLTDPGVLTALQMTLQELTGNWKVYGASPPGVSPSPAPTQQVGAALFASGVEGFMAPSAKDPKQRSLVIFAQNLSPNSFAAHAYPATGQVYRL